MSRYTGSRLKIIRSLGVELPGLSRKSSQARPQPPGQQAGPDAAPFPLVVQHVVEYYTKRT